MKSIKIGSTEFVISGRFLKVIQIPESYEDYVDIDDPEKVISILKSLKPSPDIFTFWQRLPETQPKYPYYMEWDNVAAIHVRSFDEWFNKSIHPSVRTKLRKAKKRGVVTKVVDFNEDLIKGMAEIFNETPIRQGRPFPHYGTIYPEIRSRWSVDLEMSSFIGSYFENELIGFTKLTYTERYAELSGTVCKLKYRDKSPMNALMAEGVQFCESKKLPYLTYGKFTYGNKGEDSLSNFKRYNGFKKINLPRYYVPLTLRGQVGIKFGLHHELSYHLPSQLVKMLLRLRRKYYLSSTAPLKR